MNPNQNDGDLRYEGDNIELLPPWFNQLPYPEEPPPAYSSVVVDSATPTNQSFTNEAFNAEHDVPFTNPPAYSSVVVDPSAYNQSFNNEAFTAAHDVSFSTASAAAVFTAAASTESKPLEETPITDQIPLKTISGSISKPEVGGDEARQRSNSDGSNAGSESGRDSPFMIILCMIVNPLFCLVATCCIVLGLEPKKRKQLCGGCFFICPPLL